MWKILMASKDCIDKCLGCLTNKTLVFPCLPVTFNEILRRKCCKDNLAVGIWSKMSTKFPVLLSDGVSSPLSRKCNNGVSIHKHVSYQTIGHLIICNSEEATVSRLFFNCNYTRKLLLTLLETLEAYINQSGKSRTGHYQDRRRILEWGT